MDLIVVDAEHRDTDGVERFAAVLQQSSPSLLTTLEGLLAELVERDTEGRL